MSEIHQKTVDAILHELGSRRMLDDIDDDLHQEIGEAVAVVAGVPALIAIIARAETAERERDELRAKLAAERERCAKIADEHLARIADHHPDIPRDDELAQGYGNAALNIAAAIRAEQAK